VSKKIKKPIKLRKPKKDNQKNRTVKKNRLNQLKFWKTDRFGFGFISLKPKNRTELKSEKNQAKPEKNKPNRKNRAKTEPNRFEQVFVLKNQTEPKSVGLDLVSGLKKIIWFGYFFFNKNRTEPKIIIYTQLFNISDLFELVTMWNCHYSYICIYKNLKVKADK
jgi:hypothetical protein